MDLIIFAGFHEKTNRGKAMVPPNNVVSTQGQSLKLSNVTNGIINGSDFVE